MKRLIFILLFSAVSLMCFAQEGDNRYGKGGFPFIVVTPDSVSQAPVFSDIDFNNLSTSIVFKVGKSDISPEDPFFNLYREEILTRINGQHLQLRKIYIRGAASPEGPYENNVRLGRARANALLEALRKDLKHQYIETDTEITCITEDYGYLCYLMQKAGDSDWNRVQDIFDEFGKNEKACKRKLQSLDGGRLWKRLLKEYFPQLRAARLILWFSEPDEEHAPERMETVEVLAPIHAPSLTVPDTAGLAIRPEPAPEYIRRSLIAVKTNLLHDFLVLPQIGVAFSPNVQLEFFPKDGHWSCNLGFTFGNWRKTKDHRYFQVRSLQAEARRYFKGEGQFNGLYLGAYAEGNIFGIGLNAGKGAQGEGVGAGITGGWVKPITKDGRLKIELNLALGLYVTRYDPYVWGNPVTGTADGKYYYNYLGSASAFKKRNHLFTWLGPTNVGIQLSYDLFRRREMPPSR